MDTSAPLISYGETPEAIEPCEARSAPPPMLAELFLAVDAPAGDRRQHAALPASTATTAVIISLVGMALAGPSL